LVFDFWCDGQCVADCVADCVRHSLADCVADCVRHSRLFRKNHSQNVPIKIAILVVFELDPRLAYAVAN
jgi:hypothetical protein